MANRLLLVRHGETTASQAGRFCGATDLPLSGPGRQQASALAGLVRNFAPNRCLASSLRRARQTAELIAGPLGLPVEYDDDLREIDFGRWEGCSFQEISERDPELVEKWAAWEEDFGFPAGEKLSAFQTRVRRCAERLAGQEQETVMAVTHGGIIRQMLCHLLDLPLRHYLLFEVRPGTVARVELFGRKGILSGLNLTARGE